MEILTKYKRNQKTSVLRQTKGITLITLVVTIVVLLILAGVSVSTIVGDKDVINKAKEAKSASENLDELEAIRLALIKVVTHSRAGVIDVEDLNNALDGLIEGEIQGTGPWTVVGKSGIEYYISTDGEVSNFNGVIINPESARLIIGNEESANLTAELSLNLEGKTITWEIKGDNAGSLSLSEVTGSTTTVSLKEGAVAGKATVVAKTSDGSGEEGKCIVNVVEPTVKIVDHIGLNINSITINIGANSSAITATAYAVNNEVIQGTTAIYSSNNTSVATVDENGVVTGVTEGTTTITVTIGEESAECIVTVSDPVNSITVSPNSLILNDGDSSSAITATVYGLSGNVKNGITVSFASSDANLATVDSSGVVTGVDEGNPTIYVYYDANANGNRDNGEIYASVGVTVNKPLRFGDSVAYTTSHNNETLNDWKVFYKETISGTEYVYLIFADYLPYSAIGNITGLEEGNPGPNKSYCVRASSNRTQLLNAMTTTSNWTSLLTGTINGNTIDYTETSDTNIYAMGSPTLDLWQASWNAKYPNTSTYTTNQLYTTQNATGYLVSRTNTTSTSSEYNISMSGSQGYTSATNADSLYFPHASINSTYENCWGYWLASPSANGSNYVMTVDTCGWVYAYRYFYASNAFRPVVCLPASIIE